MRIANTDTYCVRPLLVGKDDEGCDVISYEEPREINANISPLSVNAQREIYGNIDDIMLLMLHEDDKPLNKGDGVHVENDATSDPDYEVLKSWKDGHIITHLKKRV